MPGDNESNDWCDDVVRSRWERELSRNAKTATVETCGPPHTNNAVPCLKHYPQCIETKLYKHSAQTLYKHSTSAVQTCGHCALFETLLILLPIFKMNQLAAIILTTSISRIERAMKKSGIGRHSLFAPVAMENRNIFCPFPRTQNCSSLWVSQRNFWERGLLKIKWHFPKNSYFFLYLRTWPKDSVLNCASRKLHTQKWSWLPLNAT